MLNLFTYHRRNFYFYAKIDGASCLIQNNPDVSHCSGDGRFIAATVARLSNIIGKSKLQNDLLHLNLVKFISENGVNIRFRYHENCVSYKYKFVTYKYTS